jgi:Flp pilus assembly pilin Flp
MPLIVRNQRGRQFINLVDFRPDTDPYCLSVPTPIDGDRDNQGETITMMNIVENYSAETAIDNDEGVVAIEYVITAAALVLALAALWSAFGTALTARLNTVVNSI